MSNFTRLLAKTELMDHVLFCCIHDLCNIYAYLAHYKLRQYLRHNHAI